LDEFSLLGRLFTLGSFLNNRGSQNFWASLFHGENFVLILTKIGLGYVLGDFFTNALVIKEG
jgi:hypothetical protein